MLLGEVFWDRLMGIFYTDDADYTDYTDLFLRFCGVFYRKGHKGLYREVREGFFCVGK